MKKPKFHWGTVAVHESSVGHLISVRAQILGDTGLCLNQYDPLKPAGKFVSGEFSCREHHLGVTTVNVIAINVDIQKIVVGTDFLKLLVGFA